MGFKFLEHTADVKILVEEKTLSKAFSTAALALKEVMAEQILVAPRIKREINTEGKDLEALLYSFLENMIYLADAESFILSKPPIVKIEKNPGGFSLKANLIGDDAKKYIFTNEVKAITYNEMLIQEDKAKDKVIIQFVLDV